MANLFSVMLILINSSNTKINLAWKLSAIAQTEINYIHEAERFIDLFGQQNGQGCGN